MFTDIDLDAGELFDVPNPTGTPERRLLLAVLERAILDYVGNEPEEVTQATEWLFSDLKNPSFEECSFPWVCQHLGLDMKKIATKIKAMPKRGNRKIAPWYFANSA